MTMTREAPQGVRARRFPTLRYPLAAVGGFALSAAVTAPLSADLRLTMGSWGMIAVYAVYGAFLTRTDLRERRLPDTLTLTLAARSEEHTSELQSLMRISYAVFCLKKKTTQTHVTRDNRHIYLITSNQDTTYEYKQI